MQLRRLRTELRRAREDAGHTQKQVAGALGWSTSKVIRIETGATGVSTSDVMALLHYYGIHDPARTDAMLAITRAKESAWWDEYQHHYGQDFLNFLGYEASASGVRQYQGLVVPGLLQTERYASALFGIYMSDRDRIDRAVRVRMRRQAVLERAGNRKLYFILDEAVIHRLVGDAEVMLGQLARIDELNKLEHISIRIVPFTAGVHPGMQGSFTIFEFESDDVDSIVNLEEPHKDVRIKDDPETTSKYLETFYELYEIASTEEGTSKIMAPVVDAMRQGLSG